MPVHRRGRVRLVVAVIATLAIAVPIGWLWWVSLVPDTYSVMDMGRVDLGGGPPVTHAGSAGTAPVSVSSLTGPQHGAPDVAVTLTAEQQQVDVPGGEPVDDGYTLNGSSPGPEIRVSEGDLLQVRLVNDSVPDGITLHWHGVDVPNAEDGVAGVTQDAVPPGGEHVYRFVADDPGTYWYHSHQVSHEQVQGGLWGTLVVEPRGGTGADVDVVAAVHGYDGQATVDGRVGDLAVHADPGDVVRARVVNTDSAPMLAWVSGAAYRAVAVDGRDLVGPTDVEDTAVLVTAGGRVDLELTMPASGAAVRVGLGPDNSLVVGRDGAPAPADDEPDAELDLLSYGSPAPLPFDVSDPDRAFEYRIGRRPGFLDGRPGLWWSINGALFPDVPMFLVREGDVVTMTIENSSGEVHPMHLHGHHAVVLSRNGEPSTGSPWWVDSLDVGDGETYEIAFVADNPGVWMDHCHNLPHAADGLVAHLMYEGVTTPYVVGGGPGNEPE